MPTVYIETTIIGYLTARPSENALFAARQQLTKCWWDRCRTRYSLLTSQLVLDEAGRGDPVAAAERLTILQTIELVESSSPRVASLAEVLLSRALLPAKAVADAVHMATAAVHALDYLLTWNCRHIANADRLPDVYRTLVECGYSPPLICTPEEFSDAND